MYRIIIRRLYLHVIPSSSRLLWYYFTVDLITERPIYFDIFLDRCLHAVFNIVAKFTIGDILEIIRSLLSLLNKSFGSSIRIYWSIYRNILSSYLVCLPRRVT